MAVSSVTTSPRPTQSVSVSQNQSATTLNDASQSFAYGDGEVDPGMSKSGVAAMVDKAIANGNLQNPNAAAAAAGTFNSGKYVLNGDNQVVGINYADPSNNADGFKAASSAKLSQNRAVNALRDA